MKKEDVSNPAKGLKDYYKIYFAEHTAYEKYCKLNNEEGIAYGLTYKDLDNFMDRKYHLLLTIYFTVQNLIRLADYTLNCIV